VRSGPQKQQLSATVEVQVWGSDDPALRILPIRALRPTLDLRAALGRVVDPERTGSPTGQPDRFL